jgi:hypothetical protein
MFTLGFQQELYNRKLVLKTESEHQYNRKLVLKPRVNISTTGNSC